MPKKSFDLSETPQEGGEEQEQLEDVEVMETYLSSFFSNLPESSVVTDKAALELRASGLPFCPILTFLRTEQNENFEKSFYTSTGTAIHTTIQNWLSINKLTRHDIYGSWKCTGCGKMKLNQMYPSKPCGCKTRMSTAYDIRRFPKFWQYEEVEMDYKGLTMHVDLIVRIKPDFYAVVDIKTTALVAKKGGWYWKDNAPSSLSYVTQIRTYSTLLTKVHGLPIRGWCLAIVDRDMPISGPSSTHLITGEWNKSKSKRWLQYLEGSIKAYRVLQKLEAAVEEGDSLNSRKFLRGIVKLRPCRSLGDYKRYMAYKFFGKTECRFLETCTKCEDKKVYNEVLHEVNEL